MDGIVKAYFALLKALVGLLLAAMVVLVFTNVVLRYLFGSGITVSEELARWFFVWLVFLGAIVGLKEHTHLGADTLLRMLGPAGRRVCYLVSHSLMIVCCVLLVKGSYVQTLINWKVTAPATGWSVGWFYGIGLLFGISAILILTYELVQAALGRTTYEDLIAVRESEEQMEVKR
ncbi:MAG: TRAP transporter small permease [Bosea sp. (in: a-proteobacteria)]